MPRSIESSRPIPLSAPSRVTKGLEWIGTLWMLQAASGWRGAHARPLLSSAPAPAAPTPGCYSAPVGSAISNPPVLRSEHGVLATNLTYQGGTGPSGNPTFCFALTDGTVAPLLYLNRGDRLDLQVYNQLPAAPAPAPSAAMHAQPASRCGSDWMTPSSTNVHFHGMNVPPKCHADDVLHTLINGGDHFRYNFRIPHDVYPGLYWYHPHVHGLSEAAVQGGASGAIIVDGIQDIQPAVANLTEQVLVIRDQLLPPSLTGEIGEGDTPSWDLSVNHVPVLFPDYQPATLQVRPNEQQFWRVINAGADTILDLQLRFDDAPQRLSIVALDGVVTGVHNPSAFVPTLLTDDHIYLPPAGRAEFIVTTPSTAVQNATLVTLAIDTGPAGDSDPFRPLLALDVGNYSDTPQSLRVPAAQPQRAQRSENLLLATPVRTRQLYFSEVFTVPGDPDSPTNFYITEEGAVPTLFSPGLPPAVVAKQGTVEDWVIENRTQEKHEFHIHQIHFQLLERNGTALTPLQRQVFDTSDVEYWSGNGTYPSIKVRMDFRGADVGDFVYHCHILEHEDSGMMAVIRVTP